VRRCCPYRMELDRPPLDAPQSPAPDPQPLTHGPAVLFGVSPCYEAENRLDSVSACEIVSSPIEWGFPAGGPGVRDAGSSWPTQ
jgi:hypothetical protein